MRRDIVLLAAVLVVTGASWAASIRHDAGAVVADSYAAGAAFARDTDAEADDCERSWRRQSRPDSDAVQWERGCVTHVRQVVRAELDERWREFADRLERGERPTIPPG